MIPMVPQDMSPRHPPVRWGASWLGSEPAVCYDCAGGDGPGQSHHTEGRDRRLSYPVQP